MNCNLTTKKNKRKQRKMIKKLEKIYEKCSGKNLKSDLTNYPVEIGEKTMVIGRVSVRECLDCNHKEPTKAGKEKIARGMMAFMGLMLR